MVKEKGALTCPRCGHDYTSEVRQTFCPECGTPVPRQAKVCLMCGASVEDSAPSRKVPRIPLPKISWLPVRLPDSIRVTVLFAVLTLFVMLVVLLRFVGPLLAQSVRRDQPIVLTTPARLRLPTSTVTPTPSRTPTSTPTVTPSPTETPIEVYHVVAVGENPGSIAAKYDMSLEQLIEANNIEDARKLRVGQALLIPPTWTPEDATPDPDWTPTPTPFIYTVQAGDNLSSIAIWAGTTVDAIMRMNKLENPRWLSVGQQLAIPSDSKKQGTPTPTLDVEFAVHIVEKGDSLLGLAMDYGTSIEAIKQANHIEDERFIRVGESLAIPLGTSTPTPLPTPLPTKTPTPGSPYAKPIVLLPAQEERFWGDTDPILLNWISVGILGEDDWYLVELKHIVGQQEVEEYGWTRSTSWRVPPELFPGPDSHQHLFRWHVRVVHGVGADVPDPARLKSKSPWSDMRTFYWY